MSKVKSILVTGSGGVLGAAVAARFHGKGWEVTGLDLKATKAAWETIEVDATQFHSLSRVLENRTFDGLVHCAGGFQFVEIDQHTEENWDFLFKVNVVTTLNLMRDLIPKMKSQNFGRIFLIGAKATLQPGFGMGLYTASKSAINALVSSATAETLKNDICINAILPTVLDTPRNRKDMPDANFSDWVSPKEISDLIYDLVNQSGNSLRGALIPLSGKI